MSSQKILEAYMDRHKIGPLFEDMMAKVIKDMPGEPVPYLIRILQKLQQSMNRQVMSPRQTTSPRPPSGSVQTFPSSILRRSDMELSGKQVPVKQSSDPQVIIPGSKAVVSSWATGKSDEVSVSGQATRKAREYEKPWLTASKPVKGAKKGSKSESPRSKDEVQDWNKKAKIKGKGVEEVQIDVRSANNPLSKSLPVSTASTPVKTSKSNRAWAESPVENTTMKEAEVRGHPSSMVDTSADDEYTIPSGASKNEEDICRSAVSRPESETKTRRQQAEAAKKKKLEVMLREAQDGPTVAASHEDDDTEESADELLENGVALAEEGAKANTSAAQKARKPAALDRIHAGVEVRMCPKCAAMTTGREADDVSETASLFRPVARNQFDANNGSEDEEFESVSQIDKSKPFNPRWPVIADSDGEVQSTKKTDVDVKAEKRRDSSSRRVDVYDSEKSDFFKANAPPKRLVHDQTKDDVESNVSVPPRGIARQSLGSQPKQAWLLQAGDTASEADVEDDLNNLVLKKRDTWRQKGGHTDEASDL